MIDFHRLVLGLDDKALERFTRNWVSLKKAEYVEIQTYGGAQDLGRDVVGFLSTRRHEGPWHNYQCKQYTKSRVPLADGLKELGKLLYYVAQGEFTAPTKYYFVAPHGLSRPLEKLLDNPTALGPALEAGWEQYCSSKIVKGAKIPLEGKLQTVIRKFQFDRVSRITLDEMLSADDVKLVLHKRFGADPGPAPLGAVPPDVQPHELPYISELVSSYGQRDATSYPTHAHIPVASPHARHLSSQRERFFDADTFKRFYRDNTSPDTLKRLEREVVHGITDVHAQSFADSLARIDGVMQQAAVIQPGGPLAPHAGITVKQGYCHHLVNDGKLTWHKK